MSRLGQWGAPMGKVLKPLLQIAAFAVNFIPGIGQIASIAISTALMAASSAIKTGGTGTSLTPFDPKSINPDPASPRKLVFGQTTFPIDLRYAEPSGTNQEFIDYIFVLAAHKSDAITEIYIEDDLAWTAAGGAQGKYGATLTATGLLSPYLSVEVITEAGSGAYHTVNAGTIWGSNTRMTGCTTMKVRVKRSDNSKNSQSPFASGINGRWAVIGRGIPVYDPAQDSTVAGGSGSQRAATNSTWAYTAGTARGNNPALQLLTYLLGWRIGGVVSVGCGLPVDTIDLPSFATAAALCDESVALAAGGSQRRYEAGRAFADSDDPLAVIRTLLDAMNGELVDDGGRLSLRLAVNDLTPSFTLTDDDFVSGYSWKPAAPIEQQYTVVRGRYSAPGATLYGLVDYPEVSIPRTSLAPRPLTLELSAVQEPRRAERIAKQAAVRNLYQGTFTVTLGVRGWLLRRNMVVAVTSSARGWTAKLFRVRSLGFNDDATVDVVLREENAAIYAWSASESAQVTPVAPVVFDSRAAASWLMAGIEAQANLTAPNGANRVPFSRFEGDQGWASDLANISYANNSGRQTVTATLTATAGGQQNLTLMAGVVNNGVFPVQPNERLSISAFIGTGTNTSNWQINFGYQRADNSWTEIFVAYGGSRALFSSRLEYFVTVPSDAVKGNIKFYGTSTAVGSYSITVSEPMVTGAATGQTLHPAFTPGPNAANGADVTAAQPIVSRLSDTTGQALGNFVSNQGNPFAQLVASGEARDGDVITFPTTLTAPPRIFFLPGGKAVAADNIRIEASGLSTSGFTMIAKSQTVTTGSTITDGSSTTGGSGQPDRIINRTNSGAPFDGRFTYRFSVTVGNVAPGEPGYAEVALFARKGGNWTEVGRETYNATGTYNRSVTPGTVDFGTGSEFGVSLVYGEGTGTALTGFTHVQYVLGTVTEASLTPSNASPIPWQAFL